VSPDARLAFTLWLRRTHRWFGLWGATFGLLVGFSGIWLNHRAVLKLPFAQEIQNSQIALPEPAPADPAATATWLRAALQLDAPPTSVRVEKARPVPWAERAARGTSGAPVPAPRLMQPERWIFAFGGPQATLQAELWAGNRSVSIRRIDSGFIGTLTNLHKGIGMPVAWILLADTLAGSLVFLSISGVLLWWQTRRRHRREGLIFATSALVIAGLALSRL
jgi:hypothetical protein